MAKRHLCTKKIITLTFLFTIFLCVFLTSFFLIKAVFAQSAVIYVDCNAATGGDGSSWVSAFTTIQGGLNAADAENLDVWVARGTYYERINLADGVKCYGGFTGTETDLEQRDYENNQTVIDGQRGGSVVTGKNNSRIDGFTIKNGRAQFGGGIYCSSVYVEILNNIITFNEATSNGGGIYCNNCSPFIYNNTITQNTIQNSGGGIYAVSSSCIIKNNTIILNNASWGGGINLNAGSPTVEDNTISRNTSDGHGGGIYTNASSNIRRNIISKNRSEERGGGIYENGGSVIEYNSIKENYAVNFGGGIMCANSSEIYWNEITANRSEWDGGGISCIGGAFKLKNNHIVGNICDWRGGGIYFDPYDASEICNCLIAANRSSWWSGILLNLHHIADGKNVKIHNCTILDNHTAFYPDLYPGGIGFWNCTDTNHEIKNCIIRGNGYDVLEGCSVTYSNIEDGNEGLGNISEDPLFSDSINGDYHLNPNSPCINAGDPAPRYDDPDGTRNDMGIYGGPDYGVADGSIPPAPPGIIYVDINASPGGDGSSWEKAFKKIQTGLDTADDYNEEVWVAQGIYCENIVLREGVALYGGFAGTETAIDQRDFVNNDTIIDGQDKGSVVTAVEVDASMVDGFTIRNGKAQFGGGIYCYCKGLGHGLYIYIQNNIITSNEATDSGGGLYSKDTPFGFFNNTVDLNKAQNYGGGIYFSQYTNHAARIENNIITCNEAVINDGGGIFLSGTPTTNNLQYNFISRNKSGRYGGGIYNNTGCRIRNNIIDDNISLGEGGGIYETGAISTIEHNTINENYAAKFGAGILCANNSGIYLNEITTNHSVEDGGGICTNGSSPEIGNNHIISNISDTAGGGICCRSTSDPVIRNNLIIDNQAALCGAIRVYEGCAEIINNTISGNSGGICANSCTNILNSILWSNGDDLDPNCSATFSDIEDGDEGQGNISEDPMFVDPDNGDYHLDSNSPCIDMGNSLPQYNDLDWTRNDMGCYGWSDPLPDSLSVISVTPSGLVDFGEVSGHAERTFTVKNTGPGTLSGTASTSSPFSIISGGSYNLGHGESQDVVVRFSPTEVSFYSKTVSFTGGGGATRTVTGTGLEESSSCTADVDEDCDLDVFDLVFMNRYLQGFPTIVPSIWRLTNPNIPSDSEISATIEECKSDYNIDTRNDLDVFDLVIINRYIQEFSIVVPSLWRQLYPEIPPDTEIAQAAEALKPACPQARKRDPIRYYDGTGSTGQLGINNISASCGEQGARVPVYLDTNDNLFSITFDIQFDPAKLEATALEKDSNRVNISLGSDAIDNTTGRIIVNILDMTGQTAVTAGQGRILDIIFNVKTDASYDTTLAVENIRSVFSTTGATVQLAAQNGILTLPSCGIPSGNLLSIPDTTAEGGAQGVRVPVNLDIDTDLFSITFDVRFDPNKLEATALEKDSNRVNVSLGSDAIDNTTGRIIVNILDMTGQTAVTAGQGKILDILFNVKVTTPQTTTLQLQDLRSVFATSGQVPEIQLQNGTITPDGIPPCYSDADSDTYGDPNHCIQAATCPQGYVRDNTDCDDTDPNTNPRAQEICDGKDNNCDDYIDPDYEIDNDGDGLSECQGDNDDTDPNIPNLECEIVPDSVKISNISSAAVTISWFTKAGCLGEVHYSDNPDFTNPMTAYDTRGKNHISISHFVRLSGLNPETTYYFEVQSGDISDNNDGNYYSFTTCAFSMGDTQKILKGKVYQEDGLTPAEGAIVLVSIIRDNKQSYKLSSLADAEGRWSVDLRNLKSITDCMDFRWSPGDTIKIEAKGEAREGALGYDSEQDVIDSGTLPQDCGILILKSWICKIINLNAGYNLISLPFYPLVDEEGEPISFNSYSLMTHIPNCITITNWDPDSQFYYTAYMDEGMPYGPLFDILPGRAYFVLVKTHTEVTFCGYLSADPDTIELRNGYNFISCIYGPNMPDDSNTGYTSHSVLEDIPTAITITDWDPLAQFYETAYMDEGMPYGPIFNIMIGRGFILMVDRTISWTPESVVSMMRKREKPLEPLKRYKTLEATDPVISDIMVSNISSASATISWFTNIASTGIVRYSDDPNFTNPITAEDLRGAGHIGTSHYVKLSGLTQEGLYYFEVQSGNTVDDNAGYYHFFDTCGFSMGVTPKILKGKVYLEDGNMPAEGAIVFAVVEGQSIPLSALVGDDARWYLDLRNLKYAQTCEDFNWTPGNNVEITVKYNMYTNVNNIAIESGPLPQDSGTSIVQSIFLFYRDTDGDTFGDPNDWIQSPDPNTPSGYVVNKQDCDDTDGSVNPATTEICDNKNNDCDDKIDEDLERDCNTPCGTGIEICENGQWVNCTAPSCEEEFEINLSEGWSMISLPVEPDDARVQHLFPGAVVAYRYEKGSGYVRIQEGEELQVGHGYWILLNEDRNYEITGWRIDSYTLTLNQSGWYMVGGCTDPALLSDDTCSIIVMYRYVKGFGYKRVLETEKLESGRGFWMLLERERL